jgi:hypothetical protein
MKRREKTKRQKIPRNSNIRGHTQIKSENDSQAKMRMPGQNNEKKQQKKKLKTESN